jgi:hypothetical protein
VLGFTPTLGQVRVATHCLWCPKNRWSSFPRAFVALKINKNGLEVKKLHPPSGEGLFLQIIFNQTLHVAYCRTFQKILKYYFISFKVIR